MITQAEYKRLKTRLTRAINSKDNARIVEEASHGLAYFEEHGYPDQWHNWQRAQDDAVYALAREANSW